MVALTRTLGYALPVASGPEPHPFGLRLRELREERGWSQSRLADVCGTGVTAGYIARLELGYSQNPSRDAILTLASALDVPALDLLVLAGRDEPADHQTPPANRRPTVEQAIMSDPMLRSAERSTLIRIYRSYVEGRR